MYQQTLIHYTRLCYVFRKRLIIIPYELQSCTCMHSKQRYEFCCSTPGSLVTFHSKQTPPTSSLRTEATYPCHEVLKPTDREALRTLYILQQIYRCKYVDHNQLRHSTQDRPVPSSGTMAQEDLKQQPSDWSLKHLAMSPRSMTPTRTDRLTVTVRTFLRDTDLMGKLSNSARALHYSVLNKHMYVNSLRVTTLSFMQLH
jgi:hypothetical protein